MFYLASIRCCCFWFYKNSKFQSDLCVSNRLAAKFPNKILVNHSKRIKISFNATCHEFRLITISHILLFVYQKPNQKIYARSLTCLRLCEMWNAKSREKKHFYRTRTLFTDASVGRLAIRRSIKCLNTLNEIWWDDDRRLLVHVQRSLAHTHT